MGDGEPLVNPFRDILKLQSTFLAGDDIVAGHELADTGAVDKRQFGQIENDVPVSGLKNRADGFFEKRSVRAGEQLSTQGQNDGSFVVFLRDFQRQPPRLRTLTVKKVSGIECGRSFAFVRDDVHHPDVAQVLLPREVEVLPVRVQA